MADISDIEKAMVTLAASFLQLGSVYLAGSKVLSQAAGIPCKIFRGWPVSSQLDQDLAAGIVCVSVFSLNATRNRTRYLPYWREGSVIVPTLTAAVSGNSVAFDGTGGVGQVGGVRFGSASSGMAYAYRLVTGDTPATVAAQLQSKIDGSTIAGPVLTLPTDYGLQAIVAADQASWMETRRQEQRVMLTCWCPTPAARDAVASLVDAGFANMTNQFGNLTDQFSLADGSNAILRYVGSRSDDVPQKAALWRRDLTYAIEFPTTLVEMHPQVMFAGGALTPAGAMTSIQFGDMDQDAS